MAVAAVAAGVTVVATMKVAVTAAQVAVAAQAGARNLDSELNA